MTSLHELRMASQYKRSDHIVATILELEGYLAKTVSQQGTKSPDLVGPFTALLEQFRKHLKFAIEADALEAMMKADR